MQHEGRGETVFFTVSLADRGSTLLVKEASKLRQAVRRARRELPFVVDAWVVLPSHMHCVWTLPPGDCDADARWDLIQSYFAKELSVQRHADDEALDDASHEASQLAGDVAQLDQPARRIEQAAPQQTRLWHQQVWQHRIIDDADYAAHIRYCWINPVNHGLVERPEDWPYSSLCKEGRTVRFSV